MNKKRAWIVLAVALAAVTAARIYSMVNFLDFKTGFYTDGVIAGTILAVTAAAVILIVVLCNFDCGQRKEYIPVKSALSAAFCSLTGVFVLIQSFIGLTADSVPGNQISYRVFSAAGILSGVIFLVAAYDFASGTQILKKRPIYALIPSIWGCIGLIMLFINYAAMVTLIENIYHTFTVAFLLLFLFSQAKLFTGIESEKSWKRIYMFGLPAAFLSLVTGISNCVMYFAGRGSADLFPIGMQMVNILMGVYILTFLFAMQNTLKLDVAEGGEKENLEIADTHEPAPGAKQAEPIVVKTPKVKDEWVLSCDATADGDEERNSTAPFRLERCDKKNAEPSHFNAECVSKIFGNVELLNEHPAAGGNLLIQYAEFLKKLYPCDEKFVDITGSPFYT